MKKTIVCILATLACSVPVAAQNIGDQATAGFTSSRTYLNSDQGNFGPPLTRTRIIDLGDVANASSLLVFVNAGNPRLLVGEATATTTRYRLLDANNGSVQWTQVLAGSTGTLRYVPSYADDVVLLGGSATTAVSAVRVSTGAQLWQDASVGGTEGRFPWLTQGLALYHGSGRVRAADPDLGPGAVFWQFATSTAQAPLSVSGQRAYVLETAGNLRALDVSTGQNTWTVPNLFSTNPNIIATDALVYANGTLDGLIGAFRTGDGTLAWARTVAELSETPALALAYDRLFAFTSDDGNGNSRITALDPDTGEVRWEEVEPGTGIDFGQLANNAVYYYHQATGRIRVRNAFDGNLIGTVARNGVRGLSAAAGNLFVLLANQVEVYRGGNTIFFAHLADGGGQRTLLTLTNDNRSAPAEGRASFFGTDGMPLPLAIEGVGVTSDVEFMIPAGGSIGLQSMGAPTAQAGWVRVTSDQPLSGSEVFQFVDDQTGLVAFEAGVGNSPGTGRTRTFVQLFFPPDRPMTISTGVAVANLSAVESAEIVVTLADAAGTDLGEVQFTLPPRGQRARFLQELFDDETFSGFSGTLRVRSQLPIAVTALRTQGGFQLSSLPVGR